MRERAWLAAAALAPLILLAIAACLRPDQRGFGTHQQLGLAPCAFHALFGVRCPTCGMTTAWSHAMHGDWMAAARANTCGALLAAVALPGALAGLAAAACGVTPKWRPRERQVVSVALAAIAMLLAEWLWRL